jgi:NADP-reducing hydrogenase subunit HndB
LINCEPQAFWPGVPGKTVRHRSDLIEKNMAKFTSPADLKRRCEELRNGRDRSLGETGTDDLIEVKVSLATCGIASGAKAIMDFFIEQFERRNIAGVVTRTGCMGYCYAEPTVEVRLPGREEVVFGYVDIRRADQIIEKYIKTGEFVDGIIPVNYQTIDLKA